MNKHLRVLLNPIRNRTGYGGLILVLLIAVILMALVGTYQASVSVYARRHGILNEIYELTEVSEAVAVLARQSLDVAIVSPQVAGVPQCPVPGGGAPVAATGLCFKAGGCAPSALTYFCWPDPNDANSRCVVSKTGVRYCIGSNSQGVGADRDDILPVQVNYSKRSPPVAELRKVYEKKWSDIFPPTLVSDLATNFENAAVAETVEYNLAFPARMSTTTCPNGDPDINRDFCKSCSVELGCFRIALCPAVNSEADCKADPKRRLVQTVLFTN